MDTQDFNKVVSHRVTQIQEVLGDKAKEYAAPGDRMHNFNMAARIMNTTPELALKGMLLKHEVAVMDMINAAGTSYQSTLTPELIYEKIGDNINYLILLEAMLLERCEEVVETIDEYGELHDEF